MRQRKWRRISALAILLPTLLLLIDVGDCPSVSAQRKQQKQKNKPAFTSKIVTSRTPNHSVDIDVDITGAKSLHLVVLDGGNGFSCDWADWAEPRLVGASGEKKLTELKWKNASSDWGKVGVNKNAGGRSMRIAGKSVEYGIGTHANSVISFDLPEGYTRFKARGGLDNGGTDQAGGGSSSVQFLVYLNQAPKLQRRPSGGGQGLDPIEALESLDVGEGLEVTLFAAEPMLLSPSNIDVDARGRVWVCEVVNYRRRNGQRKEGDRILILEDTDGDGKADKRTVYYQGRDIDSALGICVLGNQVIVSCSPNVFVFTDTNGDDKPDKKEVLFSKTGQAQHDHSAHAFVFGPDGRLYWNFGNTGKTVHDATGELVVDLAGNGVADRGQPYRDGMAFRCDRDGKHFEVLGHNFRNNYEVAVDSFGSLWQSDNDDDGNRGVRINFVMEFGNYGYKDEITGAGWKSPRTGMASEVPLRHWHLNDPGVVPNLLQTGAGSPTGICVYEGDLLPKQFHNQMIHCDAGPNIVRAYPVKKDGAGYSATIIDVLKGTRDKWFRPADVCVAPDGSLLVADWYDPGVGGHGMGDTDRGRIFRVAPPKTPYKIPKYDYSTPEGAVEALKNPALSVRYLAWEALQGMGKKAEPALKKLYESDEPAHLRARALWVLGQLDGKWAIESAIANSDSDLRIVGLRLARQLDLDVLGTVAKLVKDESPQVRRECAIALRGKRSTEAVKLWTQLAQQHKSGDRWYLEALGIPADGNWDACLGAWLEAVGEKWDTPEGRDILWRSRAVDTSKYLVKILKDPKTPEQNVPRYLRAFDFQNKAVVAEVIPELAFGELAGSEARQNMIQSEALARLKGFDVNRNPKHKAAINRVLDGTKDKAKFIELVGRFKVQDRFPEVLAIAQKNPTDQLGVDAMNALLNSGQQKLIAEQWNSDELEEALATAQALGMSKDVRGAKLLQSVVQNSKARLALRREAVRGMAKTRFGGRELVMLASSNKLDPDLKDATAAALHQAAWGEFQAQVDKLFPLPAGKGSQPLPPIATLLKSKGDVEKGKIVFQNVGTCAKCHVVNKMGKEVGPDLTEIGTKLSLQALYESILFPSAAVSHNYESYLVQTEKGDVVTGVLVSENKDEVQLKDKDAITHTFKRSDIDEFQKVKISLMPADLVKVLSKDDLVNVVAYLQTLKKKK